ncbi:uncharacterized protein LOC142777490 [Rhipicephalus microplus]|uniref:uncharacterized protein LOC119175726 n=1 Tax=Rhipicephalus microplus TaxID=6941 RepID=UPI003F6BF218
MASTMSEETAFSTELLIDAIKHYPVLFDKCHPRYKEVEYKKELWMKIAKDLGVTGQNVTRKKARARVKLKRHKYSDTLEVDTEDLERCGSSTSDISSRQAETTDSPETQQETDVLETEGEEANTSAPRPRKCRRG